MTDGRPGREPDVIVVGDGLVGLCCALALGDGGCRVLVIGAVLPGQASGASAGMLAPSVEAGWGTAHRVGVAARDAYPGFLDGLEERTGIAVPLDRNGILQVALDDAAAAWLREGAGADASWLESRELTEVEPALDRASGALLHPRDGSVDNRRLLQALRAAVSDHTNTAVLPAADGRVLELLLDSERPAVRTATRTIGAPRIVLAAGAWSGGLAGLPRPLPLEPVRGQMIAFGGASPLHHVVYGPHGYLVPRLDCTWAGSTMERVGFAPNTTAEGLTAIRAGATTICPALGRAPELERWAGLRPVTPDFLPIIGADPERPALIYACGHSRNGVLLAPLTGRSVAALVSGRQPPVDLSAFAPSRFGG